MCPMEPVVNAADTLPADGGPQDEQEGLLGLTARGADAESSTQLQKFVSLLKQREVLAICVTQYTQSWGLYGAHAALCHGVHSVIPFESPFCGFASPGTACCGPVSSHPPPTPWLPRVWLLPGLINWLPTFFSEYYHVEISQLGGLTMLPYVVQVWPGDDACDTPPRTSPPLPSSHTTDCSIRVAESHGALHSNRC